MAYRIDKKSINLTQLELKNLVYEILLEFPRANYILPCIIQTLRDMFSDKKLLIKAVAEKQIIAWDFEILYALQSLLFDGRIGFCLRDCDNEILLCFPRYGLIRHWLCNVMEFLSSIRFLWFIPRRFRRFIVEPDKLRVKGDD